MIDWAEFHFLRPEWLLGLVLLIPLCWAALRAQRSGGAWRGVCDAHLLRHLITEGGGRTRHWPLALMALGWTAASFAMAGPAWERIPQPAFRSPQQRVLVLNLSPSMNATDVGPSRLARARYKMQDALDALGGAQAGLVIFQEEPYVVAPIADDPRVLAEFLPILEPGLMPGRGVRVDRGIAQAQLLLEQAGASQGGIVLVTDGPGDDPRAALRAAEAAAAAGYEVSVLAIGTKEGAPIPTSRGFMRDGAGEMVMARLDEDALAAIARAGEGRYASLTADDRDIESVLNLAKTPIGAPDPLEKAGVNVDVWKDMGILLVWVVAMLAPLAFRRGWATALAVAFALAGGGLAPSRAEAALEDWMWRADQRGAEAFEADRHEEAATLFEDTEWRAAAYYRNGEYQEAAALLSVSPEPGAGYNLGNALARSGRLEEAIAAYDEVLEAMPEHADAQHNRELVAKLLEDQKQQEQAQDQQQDSQSDDSGDGEESKPSESDSSGSQGSDSASESQAQSGRDSEPDSSDEQQSDGTGSSSNPEEPDTADSQPQSSEQAGDASQPTGDEAEPRAEAEHASAQAQESDAEEAGQARDPAREVEPGDGSAQQAASNTQEPPLRPEPGEESDTPSGSPRSAMADQPLSEREQAVERWLAQVSDDPAGLLREKLRRRYAEKRYRNAMGGRNQ